MPSTADQGSGGGEVDELDGFHDNDAPLFLGPQAQQTPEVAGEGPVNEGKAHGDQRELVEQMLVYI